MKIFVYKIPSDAARCRRECECYCCSRTVTAFLWASNCSAAAMVSIAGPMVRMPVSEMVWNVIFFINESILRPEYAFAAPLVGRV